MSRRSSNHGGESTLDEVHSVTTMSQAPPSTSGASKRMGRGLDREPRHTPVESNRGVHFKQNANTTVKRLKSQSSSLVCCTAPLAAVFTLACVGVVAVFATITTVSSLAFSAQVDEGMRSTLSAAMQFSMKFTVDPLTTSDTFATELISKIQVAPERYACDDGGAASSDFHANLSNMNYFFDAAVHGLARWQVVPYLYQVRRSKRYTDASGAPTAIACMVAPTVKKLSLFVNNTQFDANYTGASDLKALYTATVPPSAFSVNVTAKSFVQTALNFRATGVSWVAETFRVTPDSELSTKYTYLRKIQDPTDPTADWTLGIDHNMAVLKLILLAGTPPYTSEDLSIPPTQIAGSHSTMYDMAANTLMRSTHDGVPVAQPSGALFPIWVISCCGSERGV